MKGIDISKFNVVTDFNKVKQAGYDFVIIRAMGSNGSKPYKDPKFETYYDQAVKAGLHVGAYAYVKPSYKGDVVIEAAERANMFIDIIGDRKLDMPVYIDVEGWNKKLKNDNTLYTVSFCGTCEHRHFYTGVYGSDVSTFIDLLDKSFLLPFTWWVARYSKYPPQKATENCHIWQYTSTGTVPGIKGNVDLDQCEYLFPDIIKKKGLNNYDR